MNKRIRRPAAVARRMLLLFLAALLLCPSSGLAGEWYLFSEDDVPAALADTAEQVREFTGDFVITFLGDCTLGGEERFSGSATGFVQTIGTDYARPFANLLPLLGSDDLTVANLEGVLSDGELTRRPKQYNFRGRTDYTRILTEGSVECVTLANNHSFDYGSRGLADTKKALDRAGIAYVSGSVLAVYDTEDLRVGFTASGYSLHEKVLRAQVKLLRELGCDLVLHVMHIGVEYRKAPSGNQKRTAALAAELGCDAVVGHHPHIVQGAELIGNTPVAYSLGNCVFGGNSNPPDHDALAARTAFSFENGRLTYTDMALIPISVSGKTNRNDYCPVPLASEDISRVEQKLEASLGNTLPLLAPRACLRVEYGFPFAEAESR